jgi:hypothetical protein
MMRLAVWILLVLALPAGSAVAQGADADSARIVTEDIPRFWNAWDRMQGATTRQDSLRALFEEYYLPASPGLVGFIRLRVGSVYDLLAAIQGSPRYYASIRPSMMQVLEFEPGIRRAFHALDSLYPAAVFPDTYVLIGRLSSGGTLTDRALLIGGEMHGMTPETPTDELTDWLRTVLKPVDAIPHIVAHELIHYQQRYPRQERPTLLSQSIREGSADFLAELISGAHINTHVHAWADPRAAELWAEFRERMHGTDMAGWLYGGNDATERPADLGYWMGYRIAHAYYARTADKRQAIHDILNITDFDAFLAASGVVAEFEGAE